MKLNLKKIIIILFVFVILLTNLYGFSTNKNNINDKTLIVGDDINYPPYSYIDKEGNPVGFNIDIIKAVAEASGFRVEIVLNEWSETRKSLEKGEIDIISGMFNSKERRKIYDFSAPHSISIGDIFTNKNIKINNIKELKNKKVVVQKDDFIAEYLAKENNRLNLNIEFIEVGTVREALKLVNNGEFDYAGVLKLPALYTIKELNYNLKYQNLLLFPNDYSMAVLKGNDKLIVSLNSGLQAIKLNGKYDEIYEKWLGIYEKKDLLFYINKYKWFLYLTAFILVFLSGTSIFLKKLVEKRTEELEKQNNIILDKNILLNKSNKKLELKLKEIERQKGYINFMEKKDYLTKLPNRRSFIEELDQEIYNAKRGIVILLDIDNFKNINDSIGHSFGDKVLIEISNILRKIQRDKKDIYIARFGGDEFLILYKDVSLRAKSEELMKKVINEFKNSIEINYLPINIEFSAGITKFPNDSNESNKLLMNADLAMNDAKKLGKNNYKYFDDKMKSIINNKIKIELIIRKAIREDGFKVLYQPQIDTKTGEVVSYEALVRLKNYQISPGEFIHICEESGMIIELDRIITHKVIKQMSLWKKKFKEIRPVSINYSGKQLEDSGYFDFISNELKKYDVNSKFLEIEITENIFLENEKMTNQFLNKVKDLGIKISIDDFGTGYSSLNYLISLPISKLKIDKSLIDKFINRETSETINFVKSLIYLCHSLGLSVVAEGVETKDQFNNLKKANCDYIQGYFFSKPREVKMIEKDYYINYLEKKSIK